MTSRPIYRQFGLPNGRDYMQIMRTLILGIILISLSQVALAQCPNAIGQWTTDDATMLPGRATEGWCGADGNPVQGGQPGNTQNAMSWNGSFVGSEWAAWGMTIDADGAVLVSDTVDGSGNGVRTYSTDYVGGGFWLTKDNTWADGVTDLSGVITSYNVISRLTIQGGAIAGVSSDIIFSGQFSDCPGANNCLIHFEITNASLAWHPGFGGTLPLNYPAILCGAPTGEAFDVPAITGEITCAVPTEDVPWGSLKAMYE